MATKKNTSPVSVTLVPVTNRQMETLEMYLPLWATDCLVSVPRCGWFLAVTDAERMHKALVRVIDELDRDLHAALKRQGPHDRPSAIRAERSRVIEVIAALRRTGGIA